LSGFTMPEGLISRKAPSGHKPIRFDFRRFGKGNHITELRPFKTAAKEVVRLHESLLEGRDPLLKDGEVVMTGWKKNSPYISDSELNEINAAAKRLAGDIDDFWSTGIGGSYLGIRAGIEAVKGSLELTNMLPRERRGNTPRIFFFGQNMDSNYIATNLELMTGRRVGGAVISKSGGTVEPAIAFAILQSIMEKSYSSEEAAKYIVAITDKSKGALKKLAIEKGYQTFVVPDDVGGRYCVTSPVGLFCLAVAGVDIKEFIAGARYAEEQTRSLPFDKNIAMLRAVMRWVAHKHLGIDIELASTGAYDLRATTWWLKQLFTETEGKNGMGMWVAPQYYSEDSHASGEMVQLGKRNLMETFIMVEDPGIDITIPAKATPVEYLDGKSLNSVNQAFLDGPRDAHFEGLVPTMSYILPDRSSYTLGGLFHYEMNAAALSGRLLGQNPFIQPGVIMYKDIANARSGKPGTEAALQKMMEKEKRLNPKFII
jgi:glucose-6-phosphate isomerase